MFNTALEALRKGELVALPTDTLYGVIADASNPDAIEKFYEFKARPSGQPSQVLVNSQEMAETLSHFTPKAHKITEKFWPGALTLILPFNDDAPISKTVCGHRPTIGLRWPKNKDICDLIEHLGHPIVASSVNITGNMPLMDAASIHENFPQLIIFEGTASGNKSTIAELKDGKVILYREGDISQRALERVL